MGKAQVGDTRAIVTQAVENAEITDVHTHLYPPGFGDLLLWGIDEQLVFHYLVAEAFRWIEMPYDRFWAMPKRDQADLIWKTLFLDRSPISEACVGVLRTQKLLGLDVASRDLEAFREFFAGLTTKQYVARVFEAARVKEVVMTNDPFDPSERAVWLDGHEADPRFRAALRLDPLLMSWPDACRQLRGWGYDVEEGLGLKTRAEVRRFLEDWVRRIDALYMAVSLPPDFMLPDQSPRGLIVEHCILPVCRELDRPFSLMLGVKKRVNRGLQLAGDAVGKCDLRALEYLLAHHPRTKFMATVLARENQHELVVLARKFRNLLVFGCWWFMNNPVLIDELTRMRTEMLGLAFVPQHSDARVLDQLLYKWDHFKRIVIPILTDRYEAMAACGWQATEAEIKRDVAALFGGNFRRFLKINL